MVSKSVLDLVTEYGLERMRVGRASEGVTSNDGDAFMVRLHRRDLRRHEARAARILAEIRRRLVGE